MLRLNVASTHKGRASFPFIRRQHAERRAAKNHVANAQSPVFSSDAIAGHSSMNQAASRCLTLMIAVTLPLPTGAATGGAGTSTWAMSVESLLAPAAVLMLALILPIAVLVGRDNVRQRRREIINGLEDFFKSSSPSGGNWQILPSFEFVKSKYFGSKAFEETSRHDSEIAIKWYSLPVLIFVIISSVQFYVAFIVSAQICLQPETGGVWPTPGCAGADTKRAASIFISGGVEGNGRGVINEKHVIESLTILSFAFLGAYLASLRLFLRSIANFDLSPLTFFRGILYIVSAPIVATVLYRAAPVEFSQGLPTSVSNFGFGAWLLISFFVGFVPSLGERLLMRVWRQGRVKTIDPSAVEETKIIPLEIIDGIDAEIRARLEDHNLYDVQNLATANPIMLFVETPFGIYQTIDWVAQAQLCSGVGADRFLAFRKLGVRTIFDLEAALGPQNKSPVTLKFKLACILMRQDGSTIPDDTHRQNLIHEAERMTTLVTDDLATLRLRQIWWTIESRFAVWRSFDDLRDARAKMEAAAPAP